MKRVGLNSFQKYKSRHDPQSFNQRVQSLNIRMRATPQPFQRANNLLQDALARNQSYNRKKLAKMVDLTAQ